MLHAIVKGSDNRLNKLLPYKYNSILSLRHNRYTKVENQTFQEYIYYNFKS